MRRECHPLSLISSDNYREEGNKQGETERGKKQDKEKNTVTGTLLMFTPFCLIFFLSLSLPQILFLLFNALLEFDDFFLKGFFLLIDLESARFYL